MQFAPPRPHELTSAVVPKCEFLLSTHLRITCHNDWLVWGMSVVDQTKGPRFSFEIRDAVSFEGYLEGHEMMLTSQYRLPPLP